MSQTCFFFSYATLDRDRDPHNCIARFYDDVDREVKRKLLIKEGTAGYLDTEGTRQGEYWPEVIGQTVASAHSLVCLFSRAYFNSEYCGKEWEVFCMRVRKSLETEPGGTKWPPVILPILFDSPEELIPLPEATAEIQYSDYDFPQLYRENGLQYLMKRNRPDLKDAYQDVVDVLTRNIVWALQKHPLPVLEQLSDIRIVPNAFLRQSLSASTFALPAKNLGPRFAEFIYVAGKRNEINGLRKQVDNYGDYGGVDWKPYYPAPGEEIFLIAQSVATKEKFLCQSAAPDGNLAARLRDAEKNSRIVVIIADPWTLRLPHYRTLMRHYDEADFWNCAAMVVWDGSDGETNASRPDLEAAVRHAFLRKTRSKPPNRFFDAIGSYDEFVQLLSITLQQMKIEIIEVAATIRQITSGTPISKPNITGPGGETT